jgi:RNA polymerase sigma factor (sigma-70 family)
VAALRAGDDRAFEVLYERYQRRIATYVQGMVRDHGRAEDITQEVFISALRRMHATQRPIAFKPWIYEIAKNACIDAFRRRHAEEVSYEAEDEAGGSLLGRLASSGPTPDAAVDTRMSLDHLRGAFGSLSEVHHRILVMRELEGLSYSEIGRRLELSRPAVESTLFRARRRLTEEYEELVSGQRCHRVQAIIAGAGAGAGAGQVGVRDRRAMARHVSHCQSCRHQAALAGFDLAALAAGKALRAKIAALLPLPAFLKRRWLGGGDPTSAATVAHWSAVASTYGEQAAGGWGKAAAALVAAALLGAGAGVATHGGPLGLSGAQGQEPAGATAAHRSAPARRVAAPSDLLQASARPQGGAAPAGQAPAGSAPASDPAGAPASDDHAVGGGRRPPVAGAVVDGAPQTAQRVSDAASRPLSSVGETVDGTLGAVGTTVGGTTHAVQGAVDQTTKAVQGTVSRTTEVVSGTVAKTTQVVSGTVAKTTQAVSGTVATTTQVASGTVAKTTQAVSGTVATTTQAVSGTVAKTTQVASGAVAKTTQAVSGTVDKATKAATGTVTKATKTTKAATGGVAKTTGAASQTAGAATTQATKTTTQTATTVTGAVSGISGLLG